MSNEDTMRQEFRKLHPNSEMQEQFAEAWKACAAIKDAEIAKLKDIPMKYKRMEFNAQLQLRILAAEKEIASRDLMIKDLREAALRVDASPYTRSGIEFIKAMQQLKDALANSAHIDSKALEKALLEARIECYGKAVNVHPTDDYLRDLYREFHNKLAELNKEQ